MFGVDAETKAKLEQDAMFKLEHAGADTQRARSTSPQIDDIRRAVAGREDDYALNSTARALFRVRPDSKPEIRVDENAHSLELDLCECCLIIAILLYLQCIGALEIH